MKKLLWILILLPAAGWAQQPAHLTLEKAYELARQNYPLIKQKELLKQTATLNMSNLGKAFLPQVSFSAQGTYQSDVTQVKIPLPGINIQPPDKDQYKIIADINQLLYDGGVTREQKALQQQSEATEQQKLVVELYKIKDRINQLFLGTLYIDEQLKLADLLKKDITTGINKTTALVNNGVAFRSNLDMLNAELLKNEQRIIELKSTRKGLLDVLVLFINQPLSENSILEQPAAITATNASITRPEISLFDAQNKQLQSQQKLIDAKNMPRAGVFFQGGYGRPGLNFLKNDFTFFYTTGLRLNWSLGGFYTRKNEKQQIAISKKIVDLQKETFLLNTNAALKQQLADITKTEQLITTDNDIIKLRQRVTEAARAQLENGAITANDYLREVNAADMARQSLAIHQIQLLQAQINYQTTAGKQ